MPLRFSRGGCKGQNPAPHNAIVENTPGFPHRVEKTVDFSPPFSQPVENYVENVENMVESRGNNKKLLVQRTFYSVENFAKLAATLEISRGKVHPLCGKTGSDFYRKKV